MSIIKYSSLAIERHANLYHILHTGIEPTEEEILHWVMLWRFYAKINVFLQKFGNIFETFHYIKALENSKNLIVQKEEAEKFIQEARKIGAEIIVPSSKNYPKQLFEISDFPLALYTHGNLKLLQNRMVAIVGSRSASVDGLQIAYNFAENLSKAGITVVSGFANGIDTQACNGALKWGTVQVLGSGLQQIYPQTNIKLYKKVIENNGLFISEFPPSFHAKPTNFPMRNRIITGLCEGVLIGQASRRNGTSGTLVTLKIALHQGREIFACPGNILDERSKICNELIKKGTAHFTTTIEDILTVLNSKPQQKKNTERLEKLEEIIHAIPKGKINEKTQNTELNFESQTEIERIYNMLSTRPISVNEICEASGIEITKVQECLTELELTSKAQMNHVGKYTKCLI